MKYIISILLLFFCIGHASADYMAREITKVPIQRLIKNLENVKNTGTWGYADSQFALARLYAMTYALKKNENDKVNAYRGKLFLTLEDKTETYLADFGYEPKVIPFQTISTKNSKKNKLAKQYLEKAIAQYLLAAKLKEGRNEEKAMLSLGWCYMENGQPEEAKKYLRKAIDLTYKQELEGYMGPSVAAEAMEYLKKLLSPSKDKAELADIELKLKKLDSAPRLITPIILPMSKERTSLKQLTENGKNVAFDLDGSGTLKKWKWINPNAGWLVYKKEEKVSSALEMFGNSTFWVFWSNGYEALRALDDNGDGYISGNELENIYIWNDKNENGISEVAEILSLNEMHIAGFSTRYQSQDGILTSPAGVVFQDGSTLPTYDFISTEVK